MRIPPTLTRPLAVTLAFGAIAAPAAAGPADLHSTAPVAQSASNLSMPDTRDAAEGRTPGRMAPPVVVGIRRTSTRFQWADAGIGAAGAVGLAAILGTGVLALRRRPTLSSRTRLT